MTDRQTDSGRYKQNAHMPNRQTPATSRIPPARVPRRRLYLPAPSQRGIYPPPPTLLPRASGAPTLAWSVLRPFLARETDAPLAGPVIREARSAGPPVQAHDRQGGELPQPVRTCARACARRRWDGRGAGRRIVGGGGGWARHLRVSARTCARGRRREAGGGRDAKREDARCEAARHAGSTAATWPWHHYRKRRMRGHTGSVRGPDGAMAGGRRGPERTEPAPAPAPWPRTRRPHRPQRVPAPRPGETVALGQCPPRPRRLRRPRDASVLPPGTWS